MATSSSLNERVCEQIDDDEEEDDGDDDLGGDDEDDAHFHQLLLPNGSSLTTTHVDIISNALRNATTALNLDVADVHAGGQRRSRSRSRHRREEMGTQTTDEVRCGASPVRWCLLTRSIQRDERRESNASDPYDRERDGEREEIEGYEGDRIERVEADQRQHASVGQEQVQGSVWNAWLLCMCADVGGGRAAMRTRASP